MIGYFNLENNAYDTFTHKLKVHAVYFYMWLKPYEIWILKVGMWTCAQSTVLILLWALTLIIFLFKSSSSMFINWNNENGSKLCWKNSYHQTGIKFKKNIFSKLFIWKQDSLWWTLQRYRINGNKSYCVNFFYNIYNWTWNFFQC